MIGFGQSFAPLGDPSDPMNPQQGPPSGNPVQEAIKVLNLRMPKMRGATPAPMELLTSKGAGGNPLTALVLQLIQNAGLGREAPEGEMAPTGGASVPPAGGKPKIEYIPGPQAPEPPGPRPPRMPGVPRPNTN